MRTKLLMVGIFVLLIVASNVAQAADAPNTNWNGNVRLFVTGQRQRQYFSDERQRIGATRVEQNELKFGADGSTDSTTGANPTRHNRPIASTDLAITSG